MKRLKLISMILALVFSSIISGCGGNQKIHLTKECIESYEDKSQIYDYIGNPTPPTCVAKSRP